MDMFQDSHAVSTVSSEFLPKYLGNIEWDIIIPSINSAEEGFTFIESTLYALLDKTVVFKNWLLGKIWGQQYKYYETSKEWKEAIRQRLGKNYSDSSIDNFVLFAKKFVQDELSQFSTMTQVMAALYPNSQGQEKKSKSGESQSATGETKPTCEKAESTCGETNSTCGDSTDLELGHPKPKTPMQSKPLLATEIPTRIRRITNSIQDLQHDIRTNLKIDCPNQLPGMVSESKEGISEVQRALNELTGSLEILQDGEVAK